MAAARGSHARFRPADPAPALVFQNEITHDEHCAACKRSANLQLCGTCPGAYHLSCLDPPLKTAPKGVWVCPKCQQKVRRPPRRLGGGAPLPAHRQSAAQSCASWVVPWGRRDREGRGGVSRGAGYRRGLHLGAVDDTMDVVGWILRCGGILCGMNTSKC